MNTAEEILEWYNSSTKNPNTMPLHSDYVLFRYLAILCEHVNEQNAALTELRDKRDDYYLCRF